MLSIHGIRNVCPRCSQSCSLSLKRGFSHCPSFATARSFSAARRPAPSTSNRATARLLSTSKCFRLENLSSTSQGPAGDVEKVVRDAKQRFRDTLPKDYLNEEEYALYVRLYGPPLRETSPEDVGIPTHADMGTVAPPPTQEGVLLRELEDGKFEELTYEIAPEAVDQEVEGQLEEELAEIAAEQIVEKAPGYVDLVSRSPREHEALQRLLLDFEAAQKLEKEQQREADVEAAASAAEEASMEEGDVEEDFESSWQPERQFETYDHEVGEADAGEKMRYHPLTLEGRFHGNPVEIVLPQEELVNPIRESLRRSHHRHVRQAAETAFGGQGLPLSPTTPEGKKNGQMTGVGLPPDSRHMTAIEADAFLAGFLTPAYASVASVLREVRKRVGSEWLQSKLKQGEDGGLSVLDAGTGGAGLVAWDQIIKAEWDLLKEKGEVTADEPPGKKTVVVGSDRLRQRVKGFLDNTTFLPRLPDYEHSGEMPDGRLDQGDQPQSRKSYDVIIASHLFLKEKLEHHRQAVLNNLWHLLKPDGGVLIVIEKAHPRGFEAVAHVRDTILKQFLQPQTGEEPVEGAEELNPAFNRELEPGHIIAPCTTHGACPMYKETGKSGGRKDFCHFSQRFVRPAFYIQLLGNSSSNRGEVEFSYVAIQRGVAKDDGVSGQEAADRAFAGYEATEDEANMQALPRMILPPLKRKGHVTMDMCTPAGEIERWTVPKSFSRLGYHDARKARWGDLWALGAKSRSARTVRAGTSPEERERKEGRKGKRKPRQATERLLDAVEGMTEEERMEAMEEEATAEHEGRKPKNSKVGKKTDLMRQLLEAEEVDGAEVDREIERDLRGYNGKDGEDGEKGGSNK